MADWEVAAHPSAWTELTDVEAGILLATPKSERMTKLRELRPSLSHNQRKQSLKRQGLR